MYPEWKKVGVLLTFEQGPRGRRPLGRPIRRWEDNTIMYPKEIGINTRNWVDSAQGRNYWRALMNAALNLQVS
jgi:hypothetical protein